MMYYVSFQYSETTFCSNLAIADNAGIVREYYSKKYPWVSIRTAETWEIQEAMRKGKPIVDLQ